MVTYAHYYNTNKPRRFKVGEYTFLGKILSCVLRIQIKEELKANCGKLNKENIPGKSGKFSLHMIENRFPALFSR
jgi:hypothetical protein